MEKRACIFMTWPLRRLNVFIQIKKHFLSIWNHHKCLSYLFPLHLNTYVMGLRSLCIFYFFSAGIDFWRQNLTSTDVRFRRLKSIPALQGLLIKRCGMCIEVRRLLNMIYQTAINPHPLHVTRTPRQRSLEGNWRRRRASKRTDGRVGHLHCSAYWPRSSIVCPKESLLYLLNTAPRLIHVLADSGLCIPGGSADGHLLHHADQGQESRHETFWQMRGEWHKYII